MARKTAEHEGHPDHRALAGGSARAGVFGFSDGLVSNVSLIIGFAAGGVNSSVVRLAGIAAAVAGAASMAAGEWVSISAQNELIKREMALELRELKLHPEAETSELAAMYRQHGMSREQASASAKEVMRDPERAVIVHAREEFGVDADNLPNPIQIGFISMVSFLAGAMLPVLPWIFGGGNGAKYTSVAVAVIAAALAGGAIGQQAERSVIKSAARQVSIMLLAVGITYLIGRLVGTTIN
ncbi:membrane protein [Actinomycetes bacterium]|nr:membrane protein [Actinomycetes bacterium]